MIPKTALNRNPPSRACISGADASDPCVGSCARSVTHHVSTAQMARLAPRASGDAQADVLPYVLVAALCLNGADGTFRAPRLGRRPGSHLAPHPNLRRPIGGSRLRRMGAEVWLARTVASSGDPPLECGTPPGSSTLPGCETADGCGRQSGGAIASLARLAPAARVGRRPAAPRAWAGGHGAPSARLRPSAESLQLAFPASSPPK